jgi:hypothetical protein
MRLTSVADRLLSSVSVRLLPFRSVAVCLTLITASLFTLLLACSKYSLAPREVTVFYSNRSSHFGTGDPPTFEPGTAIVTWLSPRSSRLEHTDALPCALNSGCIYGWYGPGFRVDTIRPGQEFCEHFEAQGDQIAVEFQTSYPGGLKGIHYPGSSDGGGITWHSESSWGFSGDAMGPAGSSDGFGGVVAGC